MAAERQTELERERDRNKSICFLANSSRFIGQLAINIQPVEAPRPYVLYTDSPCIYERKEEKKERTKENQPCSAEQLAGRQFDLRSERYTVYTYGIYQRRMQFRRLAKFISELLFYVPLQLIASQLRQLLPYMHSYSYFIKLETCSTMAVRVYSYIVWLLGFPYSTSSSCIHQAIEYVRTYSKW